MLQMKAEWSLEDARPSCSLQEDRWRAQELRCIGNGISRLGGQR